MSVQKSFWKPTPLHMTESDRVMLREMIALGDAPPDAFEQCEEAARKNVYGFDYKRDRNGNPIEQGIGAWPDKVTGNHFAAIRKYEGLQAWERAVRQLYKDNPQRAKQIGLPDLGAIK